MGWREGGRVGVKNACCPPSPPPFSPHLKWTSLFLFFFFSLSVSTLLSLALAVSLCNENLSLIEGAAASWPRAAGLDCDTGYVTVMLIEVADQ